ncbi:hypothetical protein Sjap_013885 [Stephania japonica]|uniref:Uncharacterized protein n=1 Tax=Stephania japonica TaxID=461633 RepID=A0AAP0NZ13_9MAGN
MALGRAYPNALEIWGRHMTWELESYMRVFFPPLLIRSYVGLFVVIQSPILGRRQRDSQSSKGKAPELRDLL